MNLHTDSGPSLGRLMASARARAGLTVTQMARELEMSPNMISRYENDHDVPKRVVLLAYSLRCGVPMEWFGEGSTDLPTGREVGHLTSCHDCGQFAA